MRRIDKTFHVKIFEPMTLASIRDFGALDSFSGGGGQAERLLERLPGAEVEIVHLPLLQLQLQLKLVDDVEQLETLGAHVLEQQLEGSCNICIMSELEISRTTFAKKQLTTKALIVLTFCGDSFLVFISSKSYLETLNCRRNWSYSPNTEAKTSLMARSDMEHLKLSS